MDRPVGITIVAVVCFISAVVSGVGVFWLIANSDFIAIFRSERYQNLGAIMIHSGLTSSFLNALAGWGLWKLKNWGRFLTIFLAVSSSTFRLLQLILTIHPRITDFVTTGLVFTLYGLIVRYLFKANVKAAFSQAPTQILA
jgi:hypothetical protein